MDIRNIKEEPEVVQRPIEYLNHIYSLGVEQLSGYMVIEGLPNYPLNINTKQNQVILKDFISRVIEELIEGHESLLELDGILRPIGYNLYLVEKDYNKCLNCIQNANEEQADALGFFITLLVYSNIYPEDINSYMETKENYIPHSLNDIMSFGIKLQVDRDFDLFDRMNGYPIVNPSTFVNTGFNRFTYDEFDTYAPGFHSMSSGILSEGISLMWQVIYQLNIARNLLKNRPWKQSQVMSKEIDFQEALVKAFILYLGYLGLNGFKQESVYRLFFKKQRLNLWRQKSGY